MRQERHKQDWVTKLHNCVKLYTLSDGDIYCNLAFLGLAFIVVI